MLVRGGTVGSELETEGFGTVEHSLVELNEPYVFHVVHVQGDIALVGLAGFPQHADHGFGCMGVEIP